MVSSEIIADAQLLALTNFGIPSDSLRSFSLGIIVYTEINSTTSFDEGTLSNLLVFWINVLIKIFASHSVTVGGALYTKVVNNSFIISRIPLVRPFSSFKVTKTYLNNATILLV